jgi:uncharacterized protein
VSRSPGSVWARSCGLITATVTAVFAIAAAFVIAPGALASGTEVASLGGFQDEGTFRLYVNEEAILTNHFVWKSDGAYTGDCTISVGGQSVSSSIIVTPGPDGTWMEMKLQTPTGPVEILRSDSTAVIVAEEKPSTVFLKDGTVLFENYNPALMSMAVRSYDSQRGGKQVLRAFIVPVAAVDVAVEQMETLERDVNGADIRLTHYAYSLPGVDVQLYVDAEKRVIWGDVPAQHAAYVREGYESLMRPQADDSMLSMPVHDVTVEKDVAVPMRDGINLATDVYRPAADGVFPVILVRTPYRKEMNELQARYYARRGYVYVVQDCRGRFASPGTWEPFVDESRDGYDAVEWAAAQPWSSGKVGMIGASYLGWVQWWAARDRPPHLATIIPNVSPPDPYFNIPYEYGCFFLVGAIWWADVLESEATGDLSGAAMEKISEKKYATLLRHLPVIDLDQKVLGRKNPYWRKWLEHPNNDAYWQSASFLDRLDSLDIPVFHQSGWFDGDGIGSKLNYLRMRSLGHTNQKLTLGPWGHTDTAMRRIGGRDFGEAAIIDLQRDYLRWFDRWLKGVDNGIDREPLVSIFVMGSNRWLQGPDYPLPGTQTTNLYLAGDGPANTSKGRGRLTFEPPAAGNPPDRCVYDPFDPTPDPKIYDDPDEEAGEAEVTSVEERRRLKIAYHEKIDSERSDILVYQTEPLTAPLTIAGPVSAVLYAATSAKDTDWFVRMSEVDSTGGIFALVEGKIRARFRTSFSKPEPVKPDEICAYGLDLWQTGITIPAGSRLRVEVASASFPTFSRNLNTGGHNETETEFVTARQTIYHDAAHPSHVVLPVIPAEMLAP